MNYDIIYILLGIALICFGIMIFNNPVFYDSKFGYWINLTGINVPFGISLIILGGCFVWTSIRKKK
jgi:hypothetical protein